MAIDFPASPTNGQQFTAGGVTWIWDGVKWTATTTGSGFYLPLSGGTMTGDLILNRDAQVALGAATKEQVDAVLSAVNALPVAMGDNRLINGDMRIDQRNAGASGTASGYTVDRWVYQASQAGKFTWQGAASGLVAFPKCLTCVSASAYSPLAADYFRIYQYIEADAVSDFAWGAASAQPVTLSFWAYCSLTGAFSGIIANAAAPYRSYPFTFSVPVANTWTKIVVAIPGDTAGTWALSGNGAGVLVGFDLGSGSNYRASPNVWASGSYMGATGAASPVAVLNSNFSVTGVKLEIGSVATPFNRQSLAKSMADCQRYYQVNRTLTIQPYGAAGLNIGISFVIPSMRTAPTSQFANITYSNMSGLTIYYLSASSFAAYATVGATGAALTLFDILLSAEL